MPLFPEGQDPRDQQAPTTDPNAPPSISGTGLRMPLGAGQAPLGPDTSPTFAQTLGASLRVDNPIVSMAYGMRAMMPNGERDPNYNPLDDGIKDTHYENHLDRFLGSGNPKQTAMIKSLIDQEDAANSTLERSGPYIGTLARLTAGLIDPSLAIPVIGELTAATRGGRLLAHALGTAGTFAGQSAISEAMLQASQMTRTPGQSFENIGTSALLGGLFGAGVGAMISKPEYEAATKSMEAMRKDFGPASNDEKAAASPYPAPVTPVPGDLGKPPVPANDIASNLGIDIGPSYAARTAGAAEADQRQMILKPFGKEGIVHDTISKVSQFPDPVLRAMESPSLTVRRATGDLIDLGGLQTTEMKEGITPAQGGEPTGVVGNLMTRKILERNAQILKEKWVEHYGPEGSSTLGPLRAKIDTMRGGTDGKLDEAQFRDEVSKAQRNGDMHPVPEVQAAAQQIRREILDPTLKLGQSIKDKNGNPFFSEDMASPLGDKSWWARIPNELNIKRRWNEYKGIIADDLGEKQTVKAAAQERLTAMNDSLTDSKAKIKDLQTKIEGGKDIDGLADQMATETARHDSLRKQIEEEIGKWEGKSSQEAKAALKVREKAYADRAAKVEAGDYTGRGERLTSADSAVDSAVKRILESNRNLSRGELEGVAEEILNRHVNTVNGRLPYDMDQGGPAMGPFNERQQMRGSAAARRWNIASEKLPGFWHDDHQQVMAATMRTLIPDMLLTHKFGDMEMTDVFKKINEDYDRLKAQVKPGPSAEKKLKKLDDRRVADIRDLAAQRDRIRNTYGWSPDPTMRMAARVARGAMNINSATMLGSSIFNRLPDMVVPVARYGMHTFRDGWVPFIKSLMDLDKPTSALRAEMHALHIGNDGILSQATHNFTDVLNHGMGGNRFERLLASSANFFGMKLPLHALWTDWWKTMHGAVASQAFLRWSREIAETGTAHQKAIEALAENNISPDMAKRIWAEFSKPGGGEIFNKKTHVPNTGSWDPAVRRAFQVALEHEANIGVITPGAERPLVTSKPIGAVLGQFKSFTFAAHHRILLAGLQRKDADTLMGFVHLMAAGALSYRLYTLLSGQPVSDKPQDWIKEAVTRSAMLGWLSDANELQSRVISGGKTDAWRLIGAGRPLTRYDARSNLGDLLGPTWSRGEDMSAIIKAALNGNWTATTSHKFRQQLFLQNWFPIRRLLDQVEHAANNQFGIAPRKEPTAP